MRISQYSIKQATIEQIFNMFAAGQIEVLKKLLKLKFIKIKGSAEEREINLLRKSSSLSIFNNNNSSQQPKNNAKV